MGGPFVIAVDQGTTGTTVIIFDRKGQPLARAYREIAQYYPEPGWVEHDPLEMWESVKAGIDEALATSGIDSHEVGALGITNQRETTVLWDRRTGQPLHRAIVWQCRRTARICEELAAAGLTDEIAERTGLVIDAYFSGTKLQWLLDNVPSARRRAEAGDLLFGTIDSWLIWNLTGGRVHATDCSNASRTLLLNLNGCWDPFMLEHLHIPPEVLPSVKDSIGVFGETSAIGLLPAGVPIAGVAGDQQAALFGQACFEPGTVKNTYGTGCFILMNTGSVPVRSSNGLLTTIAWGEGGRLQYALEGSVFIAGAAIQWLRDGLHILSRASESESLASQVPDTGGVYLVPAFVGLGAPYWDMEARGAVVGLTRGTDQRHLARAALEAIAYQTRDVVDAMSADAGVPLRRLRVDGGASANNFLMQFQADLLGVPVERPRLVETTAFGAACMAGLGAGVYSSRSDLAAAWQIDRVFQPATDDARRATLYNGWRRAVERVRTKSGEAV